MDLGECVKVHDLALRADFEIASKQQEYFFELDVSYVAVFHTDNVCIDTICVLVHLFVFFHVLKVWHNSDAFAFETCSISQESTV